MRSMAEASMARAGDSNPGLRFGDLEWSWSEVVDQAIRRAGLWAGLRQPGPPHVAVLLDETYPNTSGGSGRAHSRDRCSSAGTRRRAGSRLGVRRRALPIPDVNCSSPTDGTWTWSMGWTWVQASGSPRPSTPRVVVVDADPVPVPVPDWPEAVAPDFEDIGPDALGYLIFTSGTTGSQKRAGARRAAWFLSAPCSLSAYALGPDSCCYLSMPLFHSNALMAGWAPAVVGGATMALPTGGRFSASGFLSDVRRYGVTYFNYVGRPLSYVLATPEQSDDADNPSEVRIRQRGGPGGRRAVCPTFRVRRLGNNGRGTKEGWRSPERQKPRRAR